MNKILVTGGTGAIGTNLVRELSKKNLVYVIDNLSSSNRRNVLKLKNVKYFFFDITEKKKLFLFFKKNKFKYIFHLAAFFANQNSVDFPDKDLKTNGYGTLYLLEAINKYNKKFLKNFIYTSSSCIYGNQSNLDENSKVYDLDTPYAVTKLLGEHYTQYFNKEFGIPSIIFRLFNSFGAHEYPGQYRNVIPNFINLAKKDMPLKIYGDGKQTRDFNYVGNVIDILNKTYKKNFKRCEIFNIGYGEEIKIIHLAKEIIKRTNSKSKIIFIKNRSWDSIKKRKSNNRKAKKFLNYKPQYDFNYGLSKTLDWFNEIN